MAHHPPHWGTLDENLLDAPERYERFTLAFHIAGHHWEAWRGSHPLRASSLDFALESANYAPERVAHPATAVALVAEALAMEWHIHCINGLLLDSFDDLDITAVREHAHEEARLKSTACGCERDDPGVAKFLTSTWWLEGAVRAMLDDWPGIVALANVLGHGHVLEPDQVAALLVLH